MDLAVVRLLDRPAEALYEMLGGRGDEQTSGVQILPPEDLMKRVVLAGPGHFVAQELFNLGAVEAEKVPGDVKKSVRLVNVTLEYLLAPRIPHLLYQGEQGRYHRPAGTPIAVEDALRRDPAQIL